MEKEPTSLRVLLSDLRNRVRKGEGQQTILNRLYELCNQLGWTMYYDSLHLEAGHNPAPLDKIGNLTIREGRLQLPDSDNSSPREMTKPFQALEGSGKYIGRVIITLPRYKTDISCKLLGIECNGVVLDARTWEILALPPRAFNRNPTMHQVEAYLKEGHYDIVEVMDTTIVTMYNWGGVWHISSNQGYDVSPFLWMGDLTYAEVLQELLKAAGHAEVHIENAHLVMPTLDPKYSYTVAFRHHNFQPFRQDPQGIWLIHVCPLDTPKPKSPMEQPEIAGLLKIPQQKCVEMEGEVTLERLRKRLDQALGDAIAERGIHYGYVLRSRSPSITQTQSDILLDSSLLKFVRDCMYRPPQPSHANCITHANRRSYNLARIALNIDPSVRAKFAALHPELEEELEECSSMINDIVGRILSSPKKERSEAWQYVVENISDQLTNSIKKRQTGFNPRHSSSRAIVEGYMYDVNNAYILTLAVMNCRDPQ